MACATIEPACVVCDRRGAAGGPFRNAIETMIAGWLAHGISSQRALVNQGTTQSSYPPCRFVLDVTRLVMRARHSTPSGIDRFELAYANWLARSSPDAQFLIRFGHRGRLVEPTAMRPLLERLHARWAGPGDIAGDQVLRACLAFLDGRPIPTPKAKTPDRLALADAWDIVSGLAGGAHRRKKDNSAVVYLNIGHWHLERLSGIKNRINGGKQAMFIAFVHDLLPIEFPEFYTASSRDTAESCMTTVLDHADATLFASKAVQDSFSAYAHRVGRPLPPSIVLPPGIESSFQGRPGDMPQAPPYFVMCGNIVARKNHALLLNVWRTMFAALGEKTPKLVIAGRRGWLSEDVRAVLDHSPLMGRCVFEARDLSTAGLAHLLAGARALLMPSLAEGYGIPVVEALASGIPVICSDIPAHRETAGHHATYVDPIDGIGWMHAILQRAEDASTGRTNAPAFDVVRWPTHFAMLENFVREQLRTAVDAAGQAPADRIESGVDGDAEERREGIDRMPVLPSTVAHGR
jgi:glycosyltransferase involved in cell wall biosynthesis